jgi:hypothetical protein
MDRRVKVNPPYASWIFTVYGGIKTTGDSDEPNAIARFVGGVTASAGVLDRLSQFIK